VNPQLVCEYDLKGYCPPMFKKRWLCCLRLSTA